MSGVTEQLAYIYMYFHYAVKPELICCYHYLYLFLLQLL